MFSRLIVCDCKESMRFEIKRNVIKGALGPVDVNMGYVTNSRSRYLW